MKYLIGAFISTFTLAVLVGAAVWPAVGDAPWEKSAGRTSNYSIPEENPRTMATPTNADRLTAAQSQAQEMMDAGDFSDSLKKFLRPSIVAYFLADTPEERARAETEIAQTFLLWRAANRPQQGGQIIIQDSGSDWRTDSKMRQLGYEIDRLERCINYDLIC